MRAAKHPHADLTTGARRRDRWGYRRLRPGYVAAAGCAAVVLACSVVFVARAVVGARQWAQVEDLTTACVTGDESRVRRLLRDGADANASNGGSMLSKASSVPIARLLLEHGADPDGPDDGGWPPVAWTRSAQMVHLLVRHGADPDKPGPGGMTPLMVASREMWDSVVEVLLDAGADPLHSTPAGETARSVVEGMGVTVGDPRRSQVERILALLDARTPGGRNTRGRPSP